MNGRIRKNDRPWDFSINKGKVFKLIVLEPGQIAGEVLLKNVCLEGLEALLIS